MFLSATSLWLFVSRTWTTLNGLSRFITLVLPLPVAPDPNNVVVYDTHLGDFTDENLKDSLILSIAEKVEVQVDPDLNH